MLNMQGNNPMSFRYGGWSIITFKVFCLSYLNRTTEYCIKSKPGSIKQEYIWERDRLPLWGNDRLFSLTA